jgi:hypothetical protein
VHVKNTLTCPSTSVEHEPVVIDTSSACNLLGRCEQPASEFRIGLRHGRRTFMVLDGNDQSVHWGLRIYVGECHEFVSAQHNVGRDFSRDDGAK